MPAWLSKLLRSETMDIKQIKSLAEILKTNGLNVIEITEGENKIRLEKSACCAKSLPEKPNEDTAEKKEKTKNLNVSEEKGVDFNNITEIKSPMVGVFYAAPSPELSPFVKIGDRVKKGDVLCIIEAMKLMNEICAENDGEIVDICAQNEQIVEYGQTLFKIF